jgi:two-component system LytT family response regulator
VHEVRETLANLEERLDPQRFARIHRGVIVNIDRIKELQPYFNGAYIVVLEDGTELRLSRRRRDTLEDLLGRTI